MGRIGISGAGLTAGLVGLAFIAGYAVAQVAGSQTGREPQFENAQVKVWKSLVLPHNPLPMHRHEHPRVIIALKGGTMDIVTDAGVHDLHVWKTGHAYWLPANPPGTHHQDVNVGDAPIEVMVVELETAS
jgi:quercetin dioxygenase-like cupin family protein